MIFFDKTRTIGQDANGKNVVWVSVYVDTAANLPAHNAYQTDGFVICMASEGRCIDTGDLYRLDSSGTWQISQAGTGTYTKSEIDALLNAKQDVLTFDANPTQNSTNPVTSGGIWTDQQRQDTLQDEDRAAISELVDGGAKNVAQTNNITQTGNGFFNTDPISGGLFVSASAVSTTASSSTFAIVFYYTDGTISPTQQLPVTNSLVHEFNTGGKVVERVRIFAGDTTGSSSGKTITLTNFMICTKSAWKISQSFQPYRPSWQQMYDMILALQ